MIVRLIFLAMVFFICACSGISEKQIAAHPVLKDPAQPVREYKVISDPTNILEKSVRTIELAYTQWGCACPNWIEAADGKKYQDSGFLAHHIYIEPADTNLYFPDSTFHFDRENIIITGQFYERPDYPQGTIEEEEPMPKARVFRYTKLRVVRKIRSVGKIRS